MTNVNVAKVGKKSEKNNFLWGRSKNPKRLNTPVVTTSQERDKSFTIFLFQLAPNNRSKSNNRRTSSIPMALTIVLLRSSSSIVIGIYERRLFLFHFLLVSYFFPTSPPERKTDPKSKDGYVFVPISSRKGRAIFRRDFSFFLSSSSSVIQIKAAIRSNWHSEWWHGTELYSGFPSNNGGEVYRTE